MSTASHTSEPASIKTPSPSAHIATPETSAPFITIPDTPDAEHAVRPSNVNGWMFRTNKSLNDMPKDRNSDYPGAPHLLGAAIGNGQEEDGLSPDGRSMPAKVPPLHELLQNNKLWAERMRTINPEFFTKLAQQQSPRILWIGCSDSRVPANQIIDLAPGEVFVHRNIANVFLNTDFNALSVLQYAVDVLHVRHVIVCGHYGCGGIAASVTNKQYGLIDNWLRNIKDLADSHRVQLDAILHQIKHELTCDDGERRNSGGPALSTTNLATQAHNTPLTSPMAASTPVARQNMLDLLCELNVAKSVNNICHTTIVQNAWARGQQLSVHGWCYRLTDGIIRDLNLCINRAEEISKIHRTIEQKVEASS